MTKPKQWSVCQDSLEPLADKLRLLASRFANVYDLGAIDQLDNEYQIIRKSSPHSDQLLTDAQRTRLAELSKLISAWKEPPCPRDVEMLYEEHDIGSAGECLKAIVSVDYAADFTLKLLSARKRFFALDFKASQILNGDIDKTSTTGIRYAIPRLIDQYYEQQHAAFPGREEQPTGDELPDHLRKMKVEILDEYSGVACEFRDVSKYLKDVAAIVREKTRLREAATPPKAHETSAPLTCLGFHGLFLSKRATNPTVLEIEKLIVAAGLTLQQKLEKIHKILNIPPTTTSRDIAKVFNVTHAAVSRTRWWKENRRGAKTAQMRARKEALREKGKRVTAETKTKAGDVRERPGFGGGKNLPPE